MRPFIDGVKEFLERNPQQDSARNGVGMNRFAALLDRLAYEPRRNAKLRLMADYFRHTPTRSAAGRSRR